MSTDAMGGPGSAVLGNDPLTAAWTSGFRSALRSYARANLPEAMVPSHFVVMAELPKLPNGKVDRGNLPPLVADTSPDDAYVAPRTQVESQLAAMWQDVLGVSRVGVESDFFDLGGNSLTVMRMAARVRETYDVRLDLRRVLEEPTVARLARMVGATADPSITGAGNPRGLSPERMRLEAVLPDDVRPDPAALPAVTAPYRSILITGGTGYTGAYLVRELLDRSDAEIHVLVRASGQAEALDRVRRNLESYGIWREGDERRLHGVAGDTGRPYLGLDRKLYRALSADIEMIVHNAADSRWTVPYSTAKPVNVLGTVEVLRFACRDRIKPMHYVCSTGAYPGAVGEHTWTESPLPDPEGVVGGYRQSKWVADTLVNTARERGVPASVYRPGALTGAQDTGACATETFINHLIRGWIQLGSAMRYDFLLELVPVDYCAAAVAHIALAGREPSIYNLPGARSVTMDEVVDHIIDCGYPLRLLPYSQWREELLAAVERGEDNELAPYLPLLDPDRPAEEIGIAGSKPVFDSTNTTEALRGSGITCGAVDRELMDRYLRYFVEIGYLPPAGASVAPLPTPGA
ncbi:MAG TPA: thioester reductase domain-containing protein [Actinokineospora sp.]|nr:thioester reductase domain-containing protein [Actinokineospora sp.]